MNNLHDYMLNYRVWDEEREEWYFEYPLEHRKAMAYIYQNPKAYLSDTEDD